jgi:crotonobetainyl-CoA:carnitine CoA-transferase CaiB-like acyl-CoA transferase
MRDRPRHLLDGYKVLDFTHFVAGPTTTRLMAGMGRKSSKSRSRREATMHASSTISIIIAVPFLFSKIAENRAFVSICARWKASI